MILDCQFNNGVRSMADAANTDKCRCPVCVVGGMFVCKLQTQIIAVDQTVEAVFNRQRDIYVFLMFQAGWKENLATFMNELKNLQCVGMTTMGAALKHAFDVLNINRMQTGIDTYGQGRCPYFLEPSVIVVITDGGKLSNSAGVQEDVS